MGERIESQPPWVAVVAAVLALCAGAACYLWWRPGGTAPALLLGSTPALTHAFAFGLLLLLAATPRRLLTRRLLLGSWLALLIAFETLQLDRAQPWMAPLVEALDTHATALGAVLRAHLRGTFDAADVLASAAGVAMAAALLRPQSGPITRSSSAPDSARDPHAPIP